MLGALVWVTVGFIVCFVLMILFARRAMRLEKQLHNKSMVMCDIYETAHNASTGPANPDTYWEIRALAEPEI